jgi:hypothetical protein
MSNVLGYDWGKVIELAVKHVGKPAVYVSFGLELDKPKDQAIWNFVTDSLKTIYEYEQYKSLIASIINSELIFFETEEQQRQFYKIFEQPLTDSSALYAVTYGQDGKVKTENT